MYSSWPNKVIDEQINRYVSNYTLKQFRFQLYASSLRYGFAQETVMIFPYKKKRSALTLQNAANTASNIYIFLLQQFCCVSALHCSYSVITVSKTSYYTYCSFKTEIYFCKGNMKLFFLIEQCVKKNVFNRWLFWLQLIPSFFCCRGIVSV